MTGLKYHYAQGKYSEALGSMAANSGPLRKRLASAYLGYLVFIPTNAFPPEMRERVSALHRALSSRPAQWEGEGAVEATVRHLSPAVVRKWINEIAAIEYSLAQIYFD